MEITKEEIKQIIHDGLSDAIDVKVRDFYIERETHYQHHQFTANLIRIIDKIQSATVKTITGIVITGIITLLVLGIIFWGRQQ